MIEENEQTPSQEINDDWVFPNVDNFDDGLFSNEYQADGGKADPILADGKGQLRRLERGTKPEQGRIRRQNSAARRQCSRSWKVPTAMIDDSLAEIIDGIIKKMVKKLIYREIDLDPKLMNKVIVELKKVLQAKKSIINVYLCEDDFNNFEKDKVKTSTVIIDGCGFKQG